MKTFLNTLIFTVVFVQLSHDIYQHWGFVMSQIKSNEALIHTLNKLSSLDIIFLVMTLAVIFIGSAVYLKDTDM
jgi:hypothetical protein